MPFSISFRQSIRWIPGERDEPTETIVLTGQKSGFFIDVRFLKATGGLDWAFAGYRTKGGSYDSYHRTNDVNIIFLAPVDEGIKTRFFHLIDSRTEVPDGIPSMNPQLTDEVLLQRMLLRLMIVEQMFYSQMEQF